MSLALVVAALRLILHHFNLLILPGENNSALDLCAFNKRRADGRVRAVVYEEHLAKDNRVTLLQIPRELLYSDSVALGDDILLPASLDYGHFHSQNNIAFSCIKDKVARISPARPRYRDFICSAVSAYIGQPYVVHSLFRGYRFVEEVGFDADFGVGDAVDVLIYLAE